MPKPIRSQPHQAAPPPPPPPPPLDLYLDLYLDLDVKSDCNSKGQRSISLCTRERVKRGRVCEDMSMRGLGLGGLGVYTLTSTVSRWGVSE